MIPLLLCALVCWEGACYVERVNTRSELFFAAKERAKETGRPLVLIGAPDGGMTYGPGCGDITIDLEPSSCPKSLVCDITKGIPLADDSAVVFVCYVLEYVGELTTALNEVRRVAGSPDNLFIAHVKPYSLAAYLYPGAKRTGPFNA